MVKHIERINSQYSVNIYGKGAESDYERKIYENNQRIKNTILKSI